jgi:hypothetical protein
METKIKSFITVGGLTYLSSRFIFEKSHTKAILAGLVAGGIMLAVLAIRTKEDQKASGQSRETSPELPELDNTRANIRPETLPAIRFSDSQPLESSVVSTLLAANPNWRDSEQTNSILHSRPDYS